MDVSILIVTYNSERFVVPCFESIKNYFADIEHEIIVVDNASGDGTVRLIKDQYPGVVLIENQGNAGFGAANNQAAKLARGDYLFLLNADTELLDDGAVRALAYAREQGIAVLGPKTLNGDRLHLRSCDKVNSVAGQIRVFLSMALFVGRVRSLLFPRRPSAPLETTYSSPEDVSFIVGAAMLIERDVCERYGLFDEDFFFTGEERDLCLRYKKAGLRLVYFPEWCVLHYVGSEAPHSCFHISNWIKSSLIFARKHGRLHERFMMRIATMLFIISYTCAFAVKSAKMRSSEDVRRRARDYRRMLLWYFGLISEQRLLAKGSVRK